MTTAIVPTYVAGDTYWGEDEWGVPLTLSIHCREGWGESDTMVAYANYVSGLQVLQLGTSATPVQGNPASLITA